MYIHVSLHIHVLLCVHEPIGIGHVTHQMYIHLMFYYIIDHSVNHTCYHVISLHDHV